MLVAVAIGSVHIGSRKFPFGGTFCRRQAKRF